MDGTVPGCVAGHQGVNQLLQRKFTFMLLSKSVFRCISQLNFPWHPLHDNYHLTECISLSTELAKTLAEKYYRRNPYHS